MPKVFRFWHIAETFRHPTHVNNKFNNQIDAIVKAAHTSQDFIKFIPSACTSIVALSKWNNVIIDTHLRRFLTSTNHLFGVIDFFNLKRISKYRVNLLHIDWDLTFTYFNINDQDSSTLFKSSFRKAHKLKFLLEELPTLEHRKKQQPELYKNWKYPLCHLHDETFTHVWQCSYNSRKLHNIIIITKHWIISKIKEFFDADVTFIDLAHDSLWTNFDTHSLNFIDIIKGIIPKFFNFLKKFTSSSVIINNFIFSLYHFIYSSIMEDIWIPRCNTLLLLEQSNNISSRTKKTRSQNDNSYILSNNFIDTPIYNSFDSLLFSIYFSRNFLAPKYYYLHQVEPNEMTSLLSSSFSEVFPMMKLYSVNDMLTVLEELQILTIEESAFSGVVDKVPDLQSQLAVTNINPLDENEFEDFFYDDFDNNDDNNFDSILKKKGSTSVINISISFPSSSYGDSISLPSVPHMPLERGNKKRRAFEAKLKCDGWTKSLTPSQIKKVKHLEKLRS
ncbi:hypothetical protein C1645_840982 [Glomus cerebriforme]|uniref:Uncharacterized protein n=1 Tax=Glomus cerebriforme TaxID=658196 RepID=A0A397S4N9_9GLOM|nr:hypothetical protein C1645_840982 [Glomus cerebriforme]